MTNEIRADVILFAAGNDGAEFSSTGGHIGSISAAKNIITVGATETSRHINGDNFDRNGSPVNPRKRASFSSLGPSLEGRIKPDVLAPGHPILSARSRHEKFTDGDHNEFGPPADDNSVYMSGTSMATALVSGCCVILQEALKLHGVRKSSAALVKALIINGAEDLAIPLEEQGFGLVNLRNSLAPIERNTGDESKGFVDVGFPWERRNERLEKKIMLIGRVISIFPSLHNREFSKLPWPTRIATGLFYRIT